MTQWIEPDDLPGLLRPGSRVYLGGSSNEPLALIDAIRRRPDCARDVTFVQQPLAINPFDFSTLHETATQESYFITPALANSEGVRFIPMQMRAIFDHLARSRMDIALLRAARDRHGDIRFGPNVDYLDAALSAASCVVVEVSDAVVAPLGAPLVDTHRINYLVQSSSPLLTYPEPVPDQVSDAIGAHIASIIRDGDCLQTGIGSVPAAMLAKLGDRNDLGFHGGLIDDGVMALVKAGNLNGSRKPFDQGRHITGMALGTEFLHAWLAETDSVVFRSADYTHDYSVISRIPNFVSVNSAVQVDLDGQVNAEVVGGRQISGTGGSVDFMRAARASIGGRSIVALSSTARGGSISRIVPRVEMATALRTDVDLIVTEYGVAALADATLAERKERLINIAHPDFRDQLRNPTPA
ncbi:MAG: acetyl-CoA hydrolase/transferase family protein [Pseudomonadota bacterium]